jgi:predicted secreted protein
MGMMMSRHIKKQQIIQMEKAAEDCDRRKKILENENRGLRQKEGQNPRAAQSPERDCREDAKTGAGVFEKGRR